VHREGTLGLGLVRDNSFQNYVKKAETIAFEAGDFMVLYTDGIIEARNGEDEEYGYDRFQKVLEENKNADPEDIGAAVMASVRDFAGQGIHDDYTVLIIKFL
jgi:serine phosphatase RsbU (regulator of sigma subunit)